MADDCPDCSPTTGWSMKLNKAATASAVVPKGKTDIILWDDDIAGFGLRVRKGGSRSWIYRYRLGQKQRVVTFGSMPAMTVQLAREQAVKLHAQVKLGLDPAAGKIESQARATEIFEYATKIFLARQKERLKPRSFLEAERHLLVHCRQLHPLALAKIERRDIAVRLNEIAAASGPAAANRTRASLGALFSWAMREGLVQHSPVVNTNKAVETGARSRVLASSELRAIWKALPDDDFGDIVKLLALTGQRRDEIGSLRCSEVDLDAAVITLPPERTKNRRPHEIPLSPPAVAILQRRPRDREYVFGRRGTGYQGWSGSKQLLDQRLSIPDWRLHDLRRTTSTVMHDELGIAPHIVEAVLNHVGHRGGVAGIYNRALYAKEKTNALARWADYVMVAVKEREPKVPAFPS
jgi:integrase